MARLGLGIAGAGIAALQVLPHLKELGERIALVALADIRRDNMEFLAGRYGQELGLYETVEEMVADPRVDAIWVASPNEVHAAHTIAAANAGKHVICEKPMAVTLEECQAMVAAVEKAGVKYVQGHSKVYDAPVRHMAQIVQSGDLGRVIHVQSWNYNDWLLRALMPQEVDTDLGTGVVFRQGPHQTDIVRYLGGGVVRSVRAVAGRHEPAYPKCEGNYTAFLEFDNGAAATMVFDGYGYFDATELTWDYGESGRRAKNPGSVVARPRPNGPMTAEQKYAAVRGDNPYGYGPGGGWDMNSPPRHPFFGITMVSCERGVMRQSLDGVYVYDRNGRHEIKLPPSPGRAAELNELWSAVTEDRPTWLDARWGMATTEVVRAILDSSRSHADVRLSHQSAARPVPRSASMAEVTHG